MKFLICLSFVLSVVAGRVALGTEKVCAGVTYFGHAIVIKVDTKILEHSKEGSVFNIPSKINGERKTNRCVVELVKNDQYWTSRKLRCKDGDFQLVLPTAENNAHPSDDLAAYRLCGGSGGMQKSCDASDRDFLSCDLQFP